MNPGIQVTIETPLFRVLAWMRYVLLGLTLMVDFARMPMARAPALVVVCGFVMVLWSVITHWAYAEPERRTVWLLGMDVFMAAVLGALSPLMLGEGTPLTGFWAVAPALAVAVLHGWFPGGLVALGLSMLTFAQLREPRLEVVGSMMGVVVGAAVLGYLADQLRALTSERDRLSADAALLAERQRLSRIVHDGVLQVLAMVEREGSALGPRGQLLAGLAREQEEHLRALIREVARESGPEDVADPCVTDLASLLDRHAGATVTVSAPVEPVPMEATRAAELDAAISEALTNVAKHAGPEARAWVLLEVEDAEAVVSIRDNGVGGDPDEFAAAMRSGRLGMKHSIYGRIHDLGGTATLGTAPGRGVEWEFRVPIEP